MRLAEANLSAIGLLRVLLVVSLLVPALLFMIASWLNYELAFTEASSDLQRTAEVAREQAAKVFESQSQVIDRVNELLRGYDVSQIHRSEEVLHDAFTRIVAHVPVIQSVLVADEQGHPLVSATIYPVPKVDLRDRDYFRAVIANYAGTYVSSPQVGEVNKQLFFGLARPWTNMAGKVSGVIDVAVSPEFFQDFYHALVGEIGPQPDGKEVTLLRDDGQFLVRYPPVTDPSVYVLANSPFLAAIKEHPASGVYASRWDLAGRGPHRIYAYRQVQGYPIYVVTGRSRASIIAGWRQTMGSHLIFGVPVTLALFAVTWTALVRTRREAEALGRARREIERRETAEAALLRSQRLEAIGQMTGGVAHDFNNLLTVILGSADMLARRADDPARVRRIADQIVLAARRGGEVTQQLLAFSRRQLINPETLDLNKRLTDFMPLLDRAAREAVGVELDLDPGLGAVRLDPGHFEAAILNLVGNARDAMPHGGQIVITTRNVLMTTAIGELPPGPYVRVAVSDNGTGMDPATAAKAFEPFFTTKEIGKGTGLGLSQVYGFAKQAGGDARIISALGEGTTVELLIPRVETQAVLGAADPDCQPLHAGRGEVVLVVEDEPGVRDMAVESLQVLGYTTLACATARAALDHLRAGDRIDLLFSDVVMPGGISGFELAAEARRLRPNLKILLTSGYTGTYPEDELRDLPLLTKPYDRDTLATQLGVLLRRESTPASSA